MAKLNVLMACRMGRPAVLRNTALALVVGSLSLTCQAQSEQPTTYVLRGIGSGSLGGEIFSNESFTLAFEGLGENLSFGSVPYSVNDHPDWTWFSQDPLSRIVFHLTGSGLFPEALNPSSYQLQVTNYGSFHQDIPGGLTFPPFSALSLCGAGMGQYPCREEPFLGLGSSAPFDFRVRTPQTPLDTTWTGSVALSTTRGELNLGNIEAASLQIITPIPEPETYALMLVGFAGLMGFKRRRMEA